MRDVEGNGQLERMRKGRNARYLDGQKDFRSMSKAGECYVEIKTFSITYVTSSIVYTLET